MSDQYDCRHDIGNGRLSNNDEGNKERQAKHKGEQDFKRDIRYSKAIMMNLISRSKRL